MCRYPFQLTGARTVLASCPDWEAENEIIEGEKLSPFFYVVAFRHVLRCKISVVSASVLEVLYGASPSDDDLSSLELNYNKCSKFESKKLAF